MASTKAIFESNATGASTRSAPNDGVFVHHAEAIWEQRDTYGESGIRGVFGNYYVSLCAAFAAIGGMIFGYDQGVVSVGWIADKISRKYSIVLAVTVFTVGSILQTASVDYAMLTVGRFIGGIGIGMLSMVAPLYISEISPPEIRGTLLVLEELSIVTGIVVAFWITYGTRYIPSEWAWRLPLLLQLLPGLILGVGILTLPFSPRWLVFKGRDDEALAALARLRQLAPSDSRVQREWLDIRAAVAFHKETSAAKHPKLQGKDTQSWIKLEVASWTDCFRHGCWRRTHVGMGLMFLQQFVGINALIYYSPTLFQTMGLNYSMQLVMSGVLNVCQLAGVITSLWTMDKFGRRPLLLWGSLAMTIAHTIIAILVGKYSRDWPSHRTAGWVSVAFLLFYMVSFGASWGPVPWAMPSEIMPSSLRAKGVALATCSNWLNNFIIGLITPPLVLNTGFGAYVFFAAFCLISLIWTWFFVPETRGRTLEAMDHVFKDAASEQEELRRQAIESDLLRHHRNFQGDY